MNMPILRIFYHYANIQLKKINKKKTENKGSGHISLFKLLLMSCLHCEHTDIITTKH